MFKISCVLFVLGLLLGFSLHNCYLCYAAHRDVSPKVTIVKKNQYNVSSLPYRAAEDLEFNIEPFPIPEYNAEPLPEPVRNVPSASSSSGNDDLEMRLNQAVHESELCTGRRMILQSIIPIQLMICRPICRRAFLPLCTVLTCFQVITEIVSFRLMVRTITRAKLR